jgi:hypothetical protein
MKRVIVWAHVVMFLLVATTSCVVESRGGRGRPVVVEHEHGGGHGHGHSEGHGEGHGKHGR